MTGACRKQASEHQMHPNDMAGFEHHAPFREEGQAKTPQPHVITIFGATGDLCHKKIMPALHTMMVEKHIPANFVIVGIGRREKSTDEFRDEMKKAIREHSRLKSIDDTGLESFLQRLFYFRADFKDQASYQSLNTTLKEYDVKFGTQGNRLFYLSVQPEAVTTIVENLAKAELIYTKENAGDRSSRVVVEKPFGHDLHSAQQLQHDLRQYLEEDQIYRIDHYLGKETVQNLLVFRFSNLLMESLWNNRYVDHVQITVAEDIGIGSRAGFYEKEGLFRDILQNHAMQLLSLIAMEAPANLLSDSVRDEKVKVLQSLRPFTDSDLDSYAIRGQYAPGIVNGEKVIGYREEDKVAKDSSTPTFGAIRCHIDNMRWHGVPFYIRAGKRLPMRCTEISVFFKKMPEILFFEGQPQQQMNSINFRIQPNEGISMLFNCKVPGPSMNIQPVKMDFQYDSYFGEHKLPEAYERLISDCLLGDSTLFARCDESIVSWERFSPLLEKWDNKPLREEHFYTAGSWGPKLSEEMMLKDGRAWKIL